MRALQELAGYIVAGYVAFFGTIAFLAIILLLWFLGLVTVLLLAVSAFGAVMYAFTGNYHAGVIALAYLGYAAIPFVLGFVFHVYRIKLIEAKLRPRRLRSVPDISGLRLARDADFAPRANRR